MGVFLSYGNTVLTHYTTVSTIINRGHYHELKYARASMHRIVEEPLNRIRLSPSSWRLDITISITVATQDRKYRPRNYTKYVCQ